jgi:hypothetical protein
MRKLLFLVAIVLCGAGPSAAQEECTLGPERCVSFPGPVGIGTTSPTEKLEIFEGFLKITRPAGSTSSAGLWLSQSNVPNNLGIWALASRNAQNLSFYNQGLNADVLSLYPNGNVSLAGNVGIGTTSPGQMLELMRDDADVGLRFHDPNNAWYSAGISKDQGRVFFINRGEKPGFYADFSISPADGNIGIGTSSAPSKLTVAGDVRVGGQRVIDETGRWVGLPTNLQGQQGIQGQPGPQGNTGQTGPQGNPGPQGQQGIPGPSVTTSVSCSDNVSATTTCSQLCAHLVGGTKATTGTCTATSDNGTCSRSGCGVNCNPVRYAICCTCRP